MLLEEGQGRTELDCREVDLPQLLIPQPAPELRGRGSCRLRSDGLWIGVNAHAQAGHAQRDMTVENGEELGAAALLQKVQEQRAGPSAELHFEAPASYALDKLVPRKLRRCRDLRQFQCQCQF